MDVAVLNGKSLEKDIKVFYGLSRLLEGRIIIENNWE